MKPLEMAAQFAAFAWYTNARQAPSRTTQAEARRFSRRSWRIFLPVAQKGWGRLLLRIAKTRPHSRHAPKGVSRPRNWPQAAAV